jgi:hypothetical protein
VGVGKDEFGLEKADGNSCRVDSGDEAYEAGEMIAGGEAKFTCF